MLHTNNYLGLVIVISFVSEGQLVASEWNNKLPNSTKIPKCIECSNVTSESAFIYYYYESNATHINNEKLEFNLTPYLTSTNFNNCLSKYDAKKNEIMGFIYNGSVILNFGSGEIKIFNPSNYCVCSSNAPYDLTIYFCENTDNPEITSSNISTGKIYFPCLIVSTLCYIFSAIVYKFILNVKDVHKKCFIGYCITMAITFFLLILLQKISKNCEYLGSIFFLFILSAFVWLFCLCLDMVYLVRNVVTDGSVMEQDTPERLYLYIAGSILIPSVMLLISLLLPEKGMPDVPNSFLKGEGMCPYEYSQIAVLFTPIGVLLILTIASLIYTFYLIRVKDKEYRTDVNWLAHSSQLKYMCYQCVVVVITMSIFFSLSLGLSLVPNPEMYENGMLFSLEIIDSLQGLLILSVFVVHYLLRGLQKVNCDSFEETRSCVMIWLPSFIWILDAMLKNKLNNEVVYAIIEGSQGIFVVAVFVTNRYTRKELYKFYKKHTNDRSNSSRFPRLRQLFGNDRDEDGHRSRDSKRFSRLHRIFRNSSVNGDIPSRDSHASRFNRLTKIFRRQTLDTDITPPDESVGLQEH